MFTTSKMIYYINLINLISTFIVYIVKYWIVPDLCRPTSFHFNSYLSLLSRYGFLSQSRAGLYKYHHLGQIQLWTIYFWEITWVLDTYEHKIITLVRLEGTLRCHLAQPLARSRADSEFRPGCLVSTVHLSTGNIQTWWSHSPSGNPVPVLNYPYRADSFPYIPLYPQCLFFSLCLPC